MVLNLSQLYEIKSIAAIQFPNPSFVFKQNTIYLFANSIKKQRILKKWSPLLFKVLSWLTYTSKQII